MDEFGQKAKQSFKLGLDFLQKKAQQAVDVTKLQGQLRSTQEQKKQALVTLGERVCAMFDMDKVEAELLKDDVQAIHEMSRSIADLERQLQDTRSGSEPHHAEPGHHVDGSEETVHPEG